MNTSLWRRKCNSHNNKGLLSWDAAKGRHCRSFFFCYFLDFLTAEIGRFLGTGGCLPTKNPMNTRAGEATTSPPPPARLDKRTTLAAKKPKVHHRCRIVLSSFCMHNAHNNENNKYFFLWIFYDRLSVSCGSTVGSSLLTCVCAHSCMYSVYVIFVFMCVRCIDLCQGVCVCVDCVFTYTLSVCIRLSKDCMSMYACMCMYVCIFIMVCVYIQYVGCMRMCFACFRKPLRRAPFESHPRY